MQTRLREHLHKLCVEIGPRPGGSPGNHAAADYIQTVFHHCGWAVEMQPFACPDWHERETQLLVADTPVLAAANAYSPPCAVTAPFLPIGTLTELERAHLTGHIAVLYGGLTRAPLAAKAWMLKDEHDERIVHLLETKQPVAPSRYRPGPASSSTDRGC